MALAHQPDRLPEALMDPENADRVFPFFIVTELPVGVTGLVIAAIFAAAMSTISTSLNSSATLLMTDWYRRLWRPEADEREAMRVLHWATLIWGILGTGAALGMMGVAAVLDAWWTIAGIFNGAMLGIFLLGILSRRADNWAGVSGVVAGVLLIVWMTLSPGIEVIPDAFRSPFHSFMIATFGTVVMLVVGFLVSRLRIWTGATPADS